MIPTRQRILDYLYAHHQASAPELARALNMTRENIRYHLHALLAVEWIEVVPAPPGKDRGRGRPIQLFRLSVANRPNNVIQLAGLLLDKLLSEENKDAFRTEVISGLAARLADAGPASKNLTQRLNHTVHHLNEKRYQARWEARPRGPLISFRNCPYAALLFDHPVLCQIDAALLEQMLGQPVEQTARIDPYTGRPPACLFVLRQIPAKAQD